MSEAEAIYYHGCMALAAAILMCVFAGLYLAIGNIMAPFAFVFACISGWHIGHVIRRSLP